MIEAQAGKTLTIADTISDNNGTAAGLVFGDSNGVNTGTVVLGGADDDQHLCRRHNDQRGHAQHQPRRR